MKAEDLRLGDVVEVTATGEVTFAGTRVVMVTRDDLTIAFSKSSPVKIRPVKLARRNYRAKVGDVITGKQLKETWWKRGTIISECGPVSHPCDYALLADGLWQDLTCETDPVSFGLFGDGESFRIERLGR